MTDYKVGVIGLGYVGLPLALEFAQHFRVIGFDKNPSRIQELVAGFDRTLEAEPSQLNTKNIVYSTTISDLEDCNVYIVAVPTPVDENNQPDLTLLGDACELVSKSLAIGDLVVFESTVFPGCTEDFCIPILEINSGLKCSTDFYCGYSPERVNPGDKTRRLIDVVKLTSGVDEISSGLVDQLYRRIIRAGTHKTSSVRVAEAAKVIENTQRDLNIALMNEISLIMGRADIDTNEVIDAASTKWNFLPFRPGLVGGHCIGVDPYYLTHFANSIGYTPNVILAGRKINDSMGGVVARKVIEATAFFVRPPLRRQVLILGYTFKENCPDVRNSRVLDIVNSLVDAGIAVSLFDPWVTQFDIPRKLAEVVIHYSLPDRKYDAVIICVAHDYFIEIGLERIRGLMKEECFFFDVKGLFPKEDSDARL